MKYGAIRKLVELEEQPGMAIKLLGVEGSHLMEDETTTQDFLMTNTPTPVGRNAEEFMQFAHQNEAGRLSGVGFLVSHPNTAAPALTRTGTVESVVTLQYWAGGAFHLTLSGGIEDNYTLQSTPDFLTWTNVATLTNDGAGVSFFFGTNGPRGFYRAVNP